MAKLTMDKLVALCKNRGYIFAGSEIYGGLANTWDYGPLGVEFKNNVKKAWWRKFVQESPYNTGLDCAILMNREVWVASGELQVFDTSTFTVNGMTAEEYVQTEDYLQDTANGGFNAAVHQIAAGYVKDGYFHESEFQSAPYFYLPIDGITMG